MYEPAAVARVRYPAATWQYGLTGEKAGYYADFCERVGAELASPDEFVSVRLAGVRSQVLTVIRLFAELHSVHCRRAELCRRTSRSLSGSYRLSCGQT